MKRVIRCWGLFTAGLLITGSVCVHAQMRAVIDVTAPAFGDSYTDDQVISAGTANAGLLSQALHNYLPDGCAIDAVMVKDGFIFFSTDTKFSAGGNDFEPNDIAAFNANTETFTEFMDGSTAQIPAGADLDAMCWLNGTSNILLSVDCTIDVSGTAFQDDDVLVFDYTPGLSLHLDGQVHLQIPARADLDALYMYGTGELAFSLDVTATIGATNVSDQDSWIYTNGTPSPMLNPQIAARADLAALDMPIDTDEDWLTDFEEATGQDDPASVFPGTSIAVAPDGIQTSNQVWDTDGDNIHDGAEAAAGTDPTDANDYLHMTSMGATSETRKVVAFASKTSRTYSVRSTENLYAGFTNELYASISGDPSGYTTITNLSATTGTFYRVNLVP